MTVKSRMVDRIAALLEVVAVFLGGVLLARWILTATGLDGASVGDVEPASADLGALAGPLAVTLLVRYGVLLSLAWAVGRWHRGRRLRAWGVQAGGMSVPRLLGAGLLLFAVGGFLPKVLFVLGRDFGVAGGPARWALMDRPWDASFWAFMAVGSFLVVPIVEELFFRGYMQTRLTEDLGAGAAIWITAVSFSLAHTQYFGLEPLTLGLFVALLFGSLLLSWARHVTGSLLPPLVAHMLGNVPTAGGWSLAVLAGMIGMMVFFRGTLRRQARVMTAQLFSRQVLMRSLTALPVVVGVLAIVLLAPDLLLALVGLMAFLVLWVEARERRERML